MFVRAECPVGVGFEEATAALRVVVAEGWLTDMSAGAYEEGISGLAGLIGYMRVGPNEDVPWLSKLVQVYVRDLVVRDGRAVLTLRWEATGRSGGLFPALDADITLTAVGAGRSLLTMNGAYRPPFGAVGAGLDKVLSRVATPTARSLIGGLAAAIETRAAAQDRG